VARPISDEELQLKKRARRRLVGAIVVVLIAAVVLPMVLDSEPKPASQNVSITIPSPEAGEYKPKAAPPATPQNQAEIRPIKGLPEPPARAETPAKSEPAPAPVTESAPATKLAAKGSDAAKQKAPPKETTAAPASDAGTSASGAYVVQVAALADAAKAKQLEQQVAGTGLSTYTEVINTQAGERTRVRVGPYATREAAETARAQLKKAGLDGQVVPR
jgi:DedD protein